MKQRYGFVSNSSSSSFILKKSVLDGKQKEQVDRFFRAYDGRWGNTELDENTDEIIKGSLEAHSGPGGDGVGTIAQLFQELIESFDIEVPNKGKTKWFDISYENEVSLDPDFKRENW